MIAAAVLATPGVHGLHAGAGGEIATYLPGRRVSGVRQLENGYDVHVVLAWGYPVMGTAEAVRAAVQQVVPGRVDVTIADVAAAGEHDS
ncbi:Asp23/Gls24 family envelope stress response protein [Allobranchiibius sp. GilTou73]|uniref:Asp23/Gls24 family envelope stress response protein n=1 Tax=Allobranchiibius sp. GilTou73 TaxID=2904523 RepID=UPI001F48E0A0|nr:Asp23/Gls24 family envelope stress response protein [Allobranchiibius sp. GilTou73]UIJ35606.1 Asp23/Gls24 family envelope stress response protein [Allobranchiibius sp. GilTou73]